MMQIRNFLKILCLVSSLIVIVTSSTNDTTREKDSNLKGEKGEKGMNGEMGQRGRDGGIGMMGIKGEKGESNKGDKGDRGERGAKGDTGSAGRPGTPGVPGFSGPPGVCSAVKSDGVKCRKGKKGEKGDSGLVIPPGLKEDKTRKTRNAWTHEHSYLLTRHSQATSNASCPAGSTKLWDGFSLVQMENYPNLGSSGSGSCLRTFSTTPIKACNSKQKCERTNQQNSHWLSAIDQENVKIEKIPLDHISRCAVCSAPALIITLHSQSKDVFDCPDQWTRIWSGYSFAMGGVQSLNDPSNCLEHFAPFPISECNQTGCHKLEFDTFWLTTDTFKQTDELPSGLNELRNDPVDGDVSRCSVCMQD